MMVVSNTSAWTRTKLASGFAFGVVLTLYGLVTWMQLTPLNPTPELPDLAQPRPFHDYVTRVNDKKGSDSGSVSQTIRPQEEPNRRGQRAKEPDSKRLQHDETTRPQGADSSPQPETERFLLYTCEGTCGGWADRQKGMVSVFLLAVVTGRRFGIRMTSPCDVTQFYVPREYDWIVRDEELRGGGGGGGGGGKTRRHLRAVDGSNEVLKSLRDGKDFNELYPDDVITMTTNNEFYWPLRKHTLYADLLPLWARQPLSGYFHDVWRMLMQPSARLERRLASLLTQLGYFRRTKPLVGFHVRIGNSATLRDSEVRNDITKLGPVWDFVADYVHNGSRLFVATDNLAVRQMSRRRFGSAHYDTGGLIVHVDHTHKAAEACPGFEAALLEQLMLTRCDVIIKAQSGFSRHAVMMRGSARNSFQFDNGDIATIDFKTM